MANSADLEILGLRELDAKLEGLSNELAGKALFSALNVALTPVVKEARALAPVADAPYMLGNQLAQPGLIGDAIRKKRLPKSEHTGEFSQGAVMGVFVGKGRKQKLYPFQWHFYENGTSRQPATPFMRPAFDNNINVMIERFSAKLAKNIDKYTE